MSADARPADRGDDDAPLVDAERKQPVLLMLESCFSGAHERLQGRYHLRDRSGSLREVEIEAGPLREATGRIAGVLLSLREITRASGMLERLAPTRTRVSVDDPQQVQVDGDIIGEARKLTCEVQPRALIVRTQRSGRQSADDDA